MARTIFNLHSLRVHHGGVEVAHTGSTERARRLKSGRCQNDVPRAFELLRDSPHAEQQAHLLSQVLPRQSLIEHFGPALASFPLHDPLNLAFKIPE